MVCFCVESIEANIPRANGVSQRFNFLLDLAIKVAGIKGSDFRISGQVGN